MRREAGGEGEGQKRGCGGGRGEELTREIKQTRGRARLMEEEHGDLLKKHKPDSLEAALIPP